MSKLICFDMDGVIFVGDSENDIGAFKFVGTSVAFNDAPLELKKAATYCVKGKDFRGILAFIA